VLLAALLAGTAYLQLRRPIPSVSARQTIADRSALPGPRPNLPWPRAGIAALGVTGLGLIETSPGERALGHLGFWADLSLEPDLAETFSDSRKPPIPCR